MLAKLRYSLIVLCLLSSHTLHAEKVLVLSNGGTAAPVHYPDNSGFLDQVLREAMKRIGYRVEIEALPNERSLINANRGILDGEVQRIEGMEKNYPNLVRVPEKVMDWRFVVFSKKKIDTRNGWESLKPYTTSYVTGWKIFEYNVPEGTNVTKVRDQGTLFKLLDNDRTDLVLFEAWQGLEIIRQNNYQGIMVSYPEMAHMEMFTYLHKKHRHLVPRLAEALREMKRDGTYQAIHQRVLAPLEK